MMRGVETLKAANLALKFLLELTALAAFAFWGTTVDGNVVAGLLGIAAPLAVIVLWGIFGAPKSRRRLPIRARVLFELAVFALAAAALFAADTAVAGIVFVAAVLVNAALLTIFDQWEA
jgi:hypothetical protein